MNTLQRTYKIDNFTLAGRVSTLPNKTTRKPCYRMVERRDAAVNFDNLRIGIEVLSDIVRFSLDSTAFV